MVKQGWFLTAVERRRLQDELNQSNEPGICKIRLLAILEMDQHRPVADVARTLGVSPRTIQRWVRRYLLERRLEALRHQPGQGRPRSWSQEREEQLRALLAQPPGAWGYAATGWTVPLLRQVLPGPEPLSTTTLRRRLHESGYVWKRFRYVLVPDPELEKKTPDLPVYPCFASPDGSPGSRRN